MARVEQTLDGLDGKPAPLENRNLPPIPDGLTRDQFIEEVRKEVVRRSWKQESEHALPEVYYYCLLAHAYHTTPDVIRSLPDLDISLLSLIHI